MEKPYLSVIIPAYNEEKRIPKTLEAVHQYLLRQSYSWEILIVNDGSKDKTIEAVETFAEGKKNVRFIPRTVNRGKGYTVKEGMNQAQGEIRLFTDADNSTDISHFDKMKPFFDSGCSVVICSRDEKDAPGAKQAVPQTSFKRLLGNMGNLFIQLFAVPGIWDTQCGFKAFTEDASKKIFSHTRINRFGFDVEALALARRYKYRICIVPAYWVNDTASTVTAANYIGVLIETMKVRWGLIIGKYPRA